MTPLAHFVDEANNSDPVLGFEKTIVIVEHIGLDSCGVFCPLF